MASSFSPPDDGFRLAPNVVILDEQTKQPATRAPKPRDYARAVFNDAGQVVEIDLSDKPYPVGPLPDDVQAFAVTASSPYPNPESPEPRAPHRTAWPRRSAESPCW